MSDIYQVVPRNYEGIKEYLESHCIEGIALYRGNGEMCKIKRSDFWFEWNRKSYSVGSKATDQCKTNKGFGHSSRKRCRI